MGRSVPGWQMTVLAAQSDELAPVGEFGRLAVDLANSPLMTFQDYADASAAAKFTPDRRFYLTGDSARIDPDGDFFFSARDDDALLAVPPGARGSELERWRTGPGRASGPHVGKALNPVAAILRSGL